MRVAVIGVGHVGLITGAALASLGHDVTGMDSDATKVDALMAGRAPFHEPGLDDLLREGIGSGRLRFTDSVVDAVAGARVAFVCVGRPPVGLGDRSLTAVEDVVRGIARAADDGSVLVVKSTVPPGTGDRIGRVARLERPDLDLVVASSPEFLREGHAIEDTLRPDRLVVGADDPRALEVMRELYAPLLERGVPLIETDPRTAELAKLASNAFLASKISFANAMARVAERAGADVDGISEIMGADPRIGASFLRAGLGYGGYCLPKDVATLERVAQRLGYDFGMLRETAKVNAETLTSVTAAIEEAVWNLEGKTIVLLGLAFKPGTDDVRGAPALDLARGLLDEGARVIGYDPMAAPAAASELADLEISGDPYVAAEGASCLVLCTEWPEFRMLDLARLKGVMAQPVIVDARNELDPSTVTGAGFHLVSIGRAGPPGPG